jgi:hypothetical protein
MLAMNNKLHLTIVYLSAIKNSNYRKPSRPCWRNNRYAQSISGHEKNTNFTKKPEQIFSKQEG